MKNKVCQNCGYQNTEEAGFCFRCGKQLLENENTVVQGNGNTNLNQDTVENQKTNIFAILSLVFGIINILWLSLWIPLITISFAITAKQKIKAFHEKGAGLATAGLVLGIIGLVLWGIVFVIRIISL